MHRIPLRVLGEEGLFFFFGQSNHLSGANTDFDIAVFYWRHSIVMQNFINVCYVFTSYEQGILFV